MSGKRNLALIGFMGSGKTTIGRLTARRLDLQFLDTDVLLEERYGMSVRELFTANGETEFRRLEKLLIDDLCSRSGLLIATGGGVVLNQENVSMLRKNCLVLLLQAEPQTLLSRIGNAESRPLLASAPSPMERISELLIERGEAYRQAAHCKINSDLLDADETVERVVTLYNTIAGEL